MASPVGRLAAYVESLAGLLGLRDWRIDVSDEPCAPEHAAYIVVGNGQRRAIIEVAETFWEEPPEDQRATIVHELLHCHFHDAHALVTRTAPLLGRAAEDVLVREHENNLERGIDAVAIAVAALLPLPEELNTGR